MIQLNMMIQKEIRMDCRPKGYSITNQEDYSIIKSFAHHSFSHGE